MKSLIIRSGKNLRPAAIKSTTITRGTRLPTRAPTSSPEIGVSAGPVVLDSDRISAPVAKTISIVTATPIGIVRIPDMMPSAIYLWSAFCNIAKPTGIVNTIVAPAM